MDYTSIKVGQLPTDEISGGNFIPHEVAGVLKKATFTDLAAFIGANDAVGFRAVSVSNGGTLPATTTQEFILVGPGTYNNVGGGSTITVTEELNALVSNGTYWFIGVEIPIDAPPGNAIWGQIVGTLSNQTDLQNLFNLKADLVDGKVPSSQLPSYVDDVIEVANYAALPATGETGKIYITIDTEYIYRWSGSAYIRIANEASAWGTITGTLSDQTDLNTALGLKVPYTGATGNVDLGSHKLTASDLVVNHASGSGVAASITKGGNGEALTVVKSSGTGNAASITGGTTLISELHLTTDLADDYIASAAAWNAKQAALNGTGFVKISGTTISYDNSTYALDSAVVHKTGNETISGVKTLQNTLNLTAGVNIDDAYGFYWKTNVGEIETALAGIGQSSSGLNFFTGSSFISPRMVINSSGNVGIGTTSPAEKLEVVTSGAYTTIYTGANGNGASGLAFSSDNRANTWFVGSRKDSYGGSVGTDRFNLLYGTNSILTATTGGNVGIGTTSPSKKLDVNGTASVSGIMSIPNMPYYANNAAALAGGLTYGDLYYSADASSATVKIVINFG